MAGRVSRRGQNPHGTVGENIVIAVQLDDRIGTQFLPICRRNGGLAFRPDVKVVFRLLNVQRGRREKTAVPDVIGMRVGKSEIRDVVRRRPLR